MIDGMEHGRVFASQRVVIQYNLAQRYLQSSAGIIFYYCLPNKYIQRLTHSASNGHCVYKKQAGPHIGCLQ